MSKRKLAAGNWKMNGTLASLGEIDQLLSEIDRIGDLGDTQVLICPPFTLLHAMADQAAAGSILIGGQDCHAQVSGAHTGDISAAALRDVGARFVIVGHSERRSDHGETNEQVCAKADAAHKAGLTAIICVGETEAQRDSDETLNVIASQIAGSVPNSATAENTVIAYEPVWAIGTGRTPTDAQINQVHSHIRDALDERFTDGCDFTLLYGGSVKPDNADQIFAIEHVDGALVGGASLKATDFGKIISALSGS